jgi:hypothetical protein
MWASQNVIPTTRYAIHGPWVRSERSGAGADSVLRSLRSPEGTHLSIPAHLREEDEEVAGFGADNCKDTLFRDAAVFDTST